MRWDKLFADLEAETHESQLVERDALIDELRDGEWASTPWSALCGGDVILVVAGARVAGHVLSVNRQIIHLRAEQNDIIVNPDWVDEISARRGARRGARRQPQRWRRGWGGHIFFGPAAEIEIGSNSDAAMVRAVRAQSIGLVRTLSAFARMLHVVSPCHSLPLRRSHALGEFVSIN